MIEICGSIEYELKNELHSAIEVWTAVAMMNSGGLSLFERLDKEVLQHHIIGIDLPTPPKILKSLLNLSSNCFIGKVYETEFIYHPKLYIVRKDRESYTAFVGSSNATYSGLKKNVELNLKITDKVKCLELIDWFNNLDLNAKLITDDIIKQYSKRYKLIKKRTKKINDDVSTLR